MAERLVVAQFSGGVREQVNPVGCGPIFDEINTRTSPNIQGCESVVRLHQFDSDLSLNLPTYGLRREFPTLAFAVRFRMGRLRI